MREFDADAYLVATESEDDLCLHFSMGWPFHPLYTKVNGAAVAGAKVLVRVYGPEAQEAAQDLCGLFELESPETGDVMSAASRHFGPNTPPKYGPKTQVLSPDMSFDNLVRIGELVRRNREEGRDPMEGVAEQLWS